MRAKNTSTKPKGLAPWKAHLDKRSSELNNPEFVAPGNVTPALISHLAAKFSPDYIVKKIEELLNASHKTKGGQDIPDNRAREGGLKLLLSYLIGLPVQRQEIVNYNFDSLEDLQRRASQSPALRASIEKLLEPPPAIQIDPGQESQGSDGQ